jgi:hypothetical protein
MPMQCAWSHRSSVYLSGISRSTSSRATKTRRAQFRYIPDVSRIRDSVRGDFLPPGILRPREQRLGPGSPSNRWAPIALGGSVGGRAVTEFPVGYHGLHPDVSMNFQMNRWYSWVGEPEMLEEMRVAGRRFVTYADWTREFGALAKSAQTRGHTRFVTADVAALIKQDVLLLAGSEDHLVPMHHVYDQDKSLSHARSVTMRLSTCDEHAQNHCQVGNYGLALQTIEDWLDGKMLEETQCRGASLPCLPRSAERDSRTSHDGTVQAFDQAL